MPSEPPSSGGTETCGYTGARVSGRPSPSRLATRLGQRVRVSAPAAAALPGLLRRCGSSGRRSSAAPIPSSESISLPRQDPNTQAPGTPPFPAVFPRRYAGNESPEPCPRLTPPRHCLRACTGHVAHRLSVSGGLRRAARAARGRLSPRCAPSPRCVACTDPRHGDPHGRPRRCGEPPLLSVLRRRGVRGAGDGLARFLGRDLFGRPRGTNGPVGGPVRRAAPSLFDGPRFSITNMTITLCPGSVVASQSRAGARLKPGREAPSRPLVSF